MLSSYFIQRITYFFAFEVAYQATFLLFWKQPAIFYFHKFSFCIFTNAYIFPIGYFYAMLSFTKFVFIKIYQESKAGTLFSYFDALSYIQLFCSSGICICIIFFYKLFNFFSMMSNNNKFFACKIFNTI